jgi:small subunit ribosomal protein S6
VKSKNQFSPKGGKRMNKYELLYIISSDVAEDKREELIKKFSSYVENKKGTVEGIDKWGMKKLAYPINFKTEGYYVLMNLTLDAQEVDAMSKLMNITEGIVRHIFVKKD